MTTQRQLFLQHNAQTTNNPLLLEFKKASGIWIYDTNNKPFMDLISGIGVSNLGHCHPAVVKAVQQQAETYMHLMVYGEYVQTPQVQLATLLAAQLPATLDCTYFVNSGAEATEGAMKLAKRLTGRKEIISCKNAYHGSTQGALSLMSTEYFKSNYGPLLPNIKHISFNDFSDLDKITDQTAAVFIELVQGEAGIRLANPEYIKALRLKCDETGTLLIFDEIQTGYGRTGHLFCFQKYGVTPDILLLAKGIGGGMPIGAFISSRQNMAAFTDNPILGHITTFGGHPVSCAAGLATLKTLLSENLIESVESKGQLFEHLLQHPKILSIRRAGLMMAVEFKDFETNKYIIDKCIEDGIITDWFLHCDNALRIAPPLIITEEEIKLACETILKNIEKMN